MAGWDEIDEAGTEAANVAHDFKKFSWAASSAAKYRSDDSAASLP